MKSLSFFLCIAVGLQTFCCTAEQSGSLQPLTTSVHQTVTSAEQPEYYAIVNAGTNQFTFGLPEGFRLGGEPAQGKLSMFNTEMAAFLTFTVSAAGSDGVVNQDSLAGRYPAGKVMEKFERPVLGRVCQVTDIAWISPRNIAQKTRVLFVPSSAGMVEITFTSGYQEFGRGMVQMNWFLNSLKLNSRERRDLIHPRSPS